MRSTPTFPSPLLAMSRPYLVRLSLDIVLLFMCNVSPSSLISSLLLSFYLLLLISLIFPHTIQSLVIAALGDHIRLGSCFPLSEPLIEFREL